MKIFIRPSIKLFCLGFTGIDSPYEPPESPEIVVKTAEMTISECMHEVVRHLQEKGVIPSAAVDNVKELFVDPANLQVYRDEAEKLPVLNITKVLTSYFLRQTD